LHNLWTLRTHSPTRPLIHSTLQYTHVPLHDFPQALQLALQPLMLHLDLAQSPNYQPIRSKM
jgi:hypothetical protein